MIVRSYTPTDCDALATIFRDAIQHIGARAYTPEQVSVWASFADDRDAFQARLAPGFALVADLDGVPAAFCHLYPVDHISLLYTAPRGARKGLATAVYRGVEAYARNQGQVRLGTDASKLARPFFERQGFVVLATEHVERQDVIFERYRMEKTLSD